MAFVLRLEGDDQILESGLDAFVKNHGWEEATHIPQLEFATTVIKKFLRQSIQNYNIEQAKAQAARVAIDASTVALDAITTSLHKEDAQGNIIIDEPVVK